MRAAITLLVLLSSMSTLTEVQAESHGMDSDIYTEVKELRDMAVEQRGILKSTQDALKKMEAENAAVKERLVVSETKVGTLTTEMTNMKMENAVIKARLVTSETKVEALERLNEAQVARLSSSEAEVKDLKMARTAHEAELIALKIRLAATETDMVNLEEKITNTPKVAFSAGLTMSPGFIQAGNTYMNLVFSKVVTNVGQAYSSLTGVFTAPVRGVYFFRLNIMDKERSGSVAVRTLKNGQQVMYNSEVDDNGARIHGSNGLTLQLEVGDTVNLMLRGGDRIYDDGSLYNNFSGFLLFPL